MSATEQFIDKLQEHGIDPGGELAGGKVTRAACSCKPLKRGKDGNGWYLYFADEPATLTWGCWNSDCQNSEGGKLTTKSEKTLTPAEREIIKARIEAERKAREEERQRVEKVTREKAARLWKSGRDVSADHPYIINGGNFRPVGAKQVKDILVIPMSTTGIGEPESLQLIFTDGSKRFLTGTGAIPGPLYHAIKGNGGPLYTAEGWKTGCSIQEATGASVVIAFSSGRLPDVTEVLKSRFPGREIVIAGDQGNGSGKAIEAARKIGGKVVFPTMPDGIEGTDFNDLYQGAGLKEVARQLAMAAEPLSIPSSETVTATETNAEEWPEPEPLPEGLPPVKTLDPAMIPAPFRGWLTDVAHRMQAPIDFAAAAAIVALGSVIGRACGIYPKRHDNWLVVPNLYGGGVGLPSVMKTPTISEGMRHVTRLEVEGQRQHEKAMEAYIVNNEVVEIQKKAICENIKKIVKNNPSADVTSFKEELAKLQSDEPTRKRYMTQDGTVEKIGELLNENPRGILINRDELIGWFRSLDKAGHESDRGFYLEGWNGNGRYTYDRITRGTIDIEALCVSIFGAVTPGPLADYIREATRGGNGADGLIQRFQVMVWPDTATEWINIDRYPDTEAKNRAYEIFKALSGDMPGTDQDDDEAIPALRFSLAGQGIFDVWRHDLETRLRSDNGLHPAIVSHLSKYRSLMPSLALIFHLIEVADGTTEPGPVTDRAAIMAAAWCDYLESHAGRIYGAAISLGLDPAKEIVKHIQRGEIKGGCTVKDIYRKHWSRLKTAEDVKAGLDVLAENDWLALERTNTGGRPSDVIRLNPRIKLL